MRAHDLLEAIHEAERFIKRADECIESEAVGHGKWQSKERAAVKRASMDLTRALVAVRASSATDEKKIWRGIYQRRSDVEEG